MEEKRKRWRPSLGAYRSLENELSELKENYRQQLAADKLLAENVSTLRAHVEALEQENSALKRSNESMDGGKKHLLAEVARLGAELEDANAAVRNLKARGFWARVFNRDY